MPPSTSRGELKKIVIEEQLDGNWKGTMIRYGKEIAERQGDPRIVVELLLARG